MNRPHQSAKRAEPVTALPFRADRWTDTEIVRGVVNGEAPAGRALFERYHTAVSRRVRRLLGPDSECADQVQMVFEQIIAHMESLRDPEMLPQWLHRITVNTVRKELRRRRRRWFLLYTPEVPDLSVSARQESDTAFRRAAAVLDRMKPDERIAFVLRYVLRDEVADIARMCGWSLSTAKRRIAQARESFMCKADRDPTLREYRETVFGG